MCWFKLPICSRLTLCLSFQRQSGQKKIILRGIKRRSSGWSSGEASEFHIAPILISVSVTQISKGSEGGLWNVREWQWGFWNCSQPSGLMCRRIRPVFLPSSTEPRRDGETDTSLTVICLSSAVKRWNMCVCHDRQDTLCVNTESPDEAGRTLDTAECPSGR